MNKRSSFRAILGAFTLLFAGIAFFSGTASAAVENALISKTGSQIATGATLSIQDQWLAYMNTNGIHNSMFYTVEGRNNVVLRFDQSKLSNYQASWNLTVMYSISLYDQTSTLLQTYTGQTLSIDYNNSSSYKDKDLLHYTGQYYYAKLTVTSVTYSGSNGAMNLSDYAGDVYLDLEQETERYYKFITPAVPPVMYSLSVANYKLPVSWNYSQGAESYDLEWLFVDIGEKGYSAAGGYAFDFRDATRINTTEQHYEIPLAYPRGILLYRVRGIGTDGASGARVEGSWSYSNSSLTGLTTTTGSSAYRLDYAGLDSTYNWQYSAAFAEDGKRKEVISYFDGSLRNRQTSTVLNTENSAVLAETKYDFEGRGALQMMPTPLTNTGIHFYNTFNENFDKSDFDSDPTYGSPAIVTTGDATGAYYANDNTATGTNAYTPDAEGYPYARSTFKRDGTNRLKTQSGVGADMKTGSGRETQYFYGTPGSQQELDRLFGNEAGNYTHYKKNMVADPNGQISISYIDQEGRIVATALSGEAPANLLPIDFKPEAASISDELLYGKNYPEGDAMTSHSTLTVSTAGAEYSFVYNLAAEQHCATCAETETCKTCKYDLEISITDEDNNPVTFTIGGSPVAGIATYTNISSETSLAFSVTFAYIGTYTVTKTLKLNEASLDAYYNEMVVALLPCATFTAVPQDVCLDCQGVCEQTYKVTDDSEAGFHYVNAAGATISSVDGEALIALCKKKCEDPSVQKSECEMMYAQLAADMSPGGQYFDNTYYDVATGTFHLQDNAWLSANIDAPDFAAFMLWINGAPAGCSYDSGVTGSWDWNSVRENWRDCFAEYLVKFHPEYCQYEFNCQRTLCSETSTPVKISASNDYDQDMQDNYSGMQYYNPTGLTPNTTADLTDNSDYVGAFTGAQLADPYFNPASYDGCTDQNVLHSLITCGEPDSPSMSEKLAAEDFLTHFVTAGTTGTPIYMSIWYVLDDPAGIHTWGTPAAVFSNTGLTVSNDVLQIFHTIHGYGSNPGLLGGTVPVMSKYQYFVSAYAGIKKMIKYQRYKGYSSQVPTDLKCDPLTGSDTHWGWTDASSSFQIRYQDAIPFKLAWENICHQDSPERLLVNSSIVTAIADFASGDGADGGLTLEAYRGNCAHYAWKWLQQLRADCPSIVPDADSMAIRNYMIEVCAHGADPINALGASSCGGCSIPGPLGSGCSFSSFDDIRNCYATLHSTTCSSSIVYPPVNVINQQVTCSCEKYYAFVDEYGPFATDAAEATAFNDFYSPSVAITATDVNNWQTECALTSGHGLTGLDNLPTSLMCPATSTETYNATTCTCTNLDNYIEGLEADHPGISSSDSDIATELNSAFHPVTDYTGSDVTAWRSACANGTVTSSTFNNLPGMLKCLDYNECTRNSLYSFITNHGFPEPPATYTGTEQTNIVDALNIAFHPATALVWSDVSAWLTACSSGTFTSTTFDNLPNGLKCTQDGMPPPPCNCEQENLQNYADAQYTNAVLQNTAAEAAARDFMAAYRAQCLNTLERETLTVTYPLNEYYYTLYYYDQAGNLIKTVPPQGVEPLTTGTVPALADVKDYRQGAGGSSFSVPSHKMVTHYWYNSLQQLVKQLTPDAGSTNFYYDYLGRLVVSQNAKQAPNDYSYTLYDLLGRIKEVGQLTTSTAISSIDTRDDAVLTPWIGAASAYAQVTRTYYDAVPAVSTLYGGTEQKNLRGRVAMSSYTDAAGASTYDHASHYSYDEHGNVKTLIQENKHLAEIGQSLKYIDYEYDLVSGNVNKVSYQDRPDAGGNPQFDRFYHKYLYDADNRITQVFTSNDDVIWKKEAKYFYYLHGPLARTELGDREVQGIDHVYTLQGWIKGVNTNVLDNTKDPGHDAQQTANLNKMFGTDAFGYTLNYFSGDYTAKKTSAGAFEAGTTTNTYFSAAPGLYNGNISMMGTTITDNTGAATPQMTAYNYDQLNRIRQATSYTAISSNVWSNTASGDRYKEEFHYDLNGNIYEAQRFNQAGVQFDRLRYHYYEAGTSSYDYTTYPGTPTPAGITNRLSYAGDLSLFTPVSTTDIDPQAANNYEYDAIGNLTADAQEEIGTGGITWSVYGKIKGITRTGTGSRDDLDFAYDATGNRVEKIVKPRPSGSLTDEVDWTGTYYVRDAQGNVMATYNRSYVHGSGSSYTDNFALAEHPIYGSSRLGVRRGEAGDKLSLAFTAPGFTLHKFTSRSYTIPTPGTFSAARVEYFSKLGLKNYELGNHLGNVLSTISDRKIEINGSGTVISSFKSEILSAQDYYAFGMGMPGRSFTSSTAYRYGFNGKENDPETVTTGNGTQDYGMRIYNPALGKFLSVDPLTKKFAFYSPYQYAGNTPIVAIDLDGLEDVWIHTRRIKTGAAIKVFSANLNELERDILWRMLTGDPEGLSDGIVYTTTNAGGELERIYPDVPVSTPVGSEHEYSFFEDADRFVNGNMMGSEIQQPDAPFYSVDAGVKVKGKTGLLEITAESKMTEASDNNTTYSSEFNINLLATPPSLQPGPGDAKIAKFAANAFFKFNIIPSNKEGIGIQNKFGIANYYIQINWESTGLQSFEIGVTTENMVFEDNIDFGQGKLNVYKASTQSGSSSVLVNPYRK